MINASQSKLIQKTAECEKLKTINKSYVYLMDEYRTENEELKSDIRILVQALSVLRKANRVLRITVKNQLQKA